MCVSTWSGAHILQLPGAADRCVSSSAPLFFTPYTNPFNAEIALPFRLAEEGEVSPVIYDILGREVRVISAETLPAGYYYDPDRALRWDARNADGNRVGSGVYIGFLQVGKRALSRKIVLIK